LVVRRLAERSVEAGVPIAIEIESAQARLCEEDFKLRGVVELFANDATNLDQERLL
jgi:hypothetical protein